MFNFLQKRRTGSPGNTTHDSHGPIATVTTPISSGAIAPVAEEDPRTESSATIGILDPVLVSLPPEILVEIFRAGCFERQSFYRDVAGLSKDMHSLALVDLLPLIAVRLQTENQARSFLCFLEANKDARGRVRHLWMVGSSLPYYIPYHPYDEPQGFEYQNIQHGIVRKTDNLLSIACTYHNFHQLCAWAELKEAGRYPHLKEVTILDGRPWSTTPFKLPKQITHLAILDPEWPNEKLLSSYFTNLRGYAFELYSATLIRDLSNSSTQLTILYLEQTFGSTSPIRQYSKLAPHTVVMVVDKNVETHVKLPGLDHNPSSVTIRVGKMVHFHWWMERTAGGMGLWGSPEGI